RREQRRRRDHGAPAGFAPHAPPAPGPRVAHGLRRLPPPQHRRRRPAPSLLEGIAVPAGPQPGGPVRTRHRTLPGPYARSWPPAGGGRGHMGGTLRRLPDRAAADVDQGGVLRLHPRHAGLPRRQPAVAGPRGQADGDLRDDHRPGHRGGGLPPGARPPGCRSDPHHHEAGRRARLRRLRRPLRQRSLRGVVPRPRVRADPERHRGGTRRGHGAGVVRRAGPAALPGQGPPPVVRLGLTFGYLPPPRCPPAPGVEARGGGASTTVADNRIRPSASLPSARPSGTATTSTSSSIRPRAESGATRPRTANSRAAPGSSGPASGQVTPESTASAENECNTCSVAGGSSATSQYRTWRVVDTKALKARRAKRHGDRLLTVSDQTKSSPGRTLGGSGRPDTDT